MGYRPEHDPVRRLGGVDRGGGEGGALGAQRCQSDGDGRERETQAERAVGFAQHHERGGGDFGADPVAFHDDEANRRIRRVGQ